MKKSKLGGTIAVFTLLCFLAGSLIVPKTAVGADKFRFIFNWIPYGLHTGFYAAQEQGYYKAAGIDITLDRGYGSSDTAKKVAAGVANSGLSDFPAVIRGRAAGLKIKALGILLDRSVNVVYARNDRGIQKPADLIGKTIGAPKVSALRSTFPPPPCIRPSSAERSIPSRPWRPLGRSSCPKQS
jgi:NitT/TauT family transport system substrate-binding protein